MQEVKQSTAEFLTVRVQVLKTLNENPLTVRQPGLYHLQRIPAMRYSCEQLQTRFRHKLSRAKIHTSAEMVPAAAAAGSIAVPLPREEAAGAMSPRAAAKRPYAGLTVDVNATPASPAADFGSPQAVSPLSLGGVLSPFAFSPLGPCSPAVATGGALEYPAAKVPRGAAVQQPWDFTYVAGAAAEPSLSAFAVRGAAAANALVPAAASVAAAGGQVEWVAGASPFADPTVELPRPATSATVPTEAEQFAPAVAGGVLGGVGGFGMYANPVVGFLAHGQMPATEPAAAAAAEEAACMTAAPAAGMSTATTTSAAGALPGGAAAVGGNVLAATAAPPAPVNITSRVSLDLGLNAMVEPEWEAASGMDWVLDEEGWASTLAAAAGLYEDGVGAMLFTSSSIGLLSAPSWSCSLAEGLCANEPGGVDVAVMVGMQHDGQPVADVREGGSAVAVDEQVVAAAAARGGAVGREAAAVSLQPASAAAAAAVAAVAPGAMCIDTPLPSAAAAQAAAAPVASAVAPAAGTGSAGLMDPPGEAETVGIQVQKVYSGSLGRLQKLLMTGEPEAARRQRAWEQIGQSRSGEELMLCEVPCAERFVPWGEVGGVVGPRLQSTGHN